jgi:hypothetical protein
VTGLEMSSKQFTILTLPLVGTLLIGSGFLVGRLSLNEAYIESDQRATTKTLPNPSTVPPPENTRPIYQSSIPVISPKNDLVLQAHTTKSATEYSLTIRLDGYPSKTRLTTTIDGVETDTGVLVSLTGEVNQLDRMLNYFSNYISWSPSENRFAILLPDQVIVYSYQAESIANDTWQPPRTKLTLTKSYAYATHQEFDLYDYPTVLFSGNGQELYYSHRNEVLMLIPQEKPFLPKSGNFPSSIYPIPNQPGIAYWISDKDEPNPNTNLFFITDYGTYSKKYKLSSNLSVDYPREIVLSPDLSKVCIGWETSGSGGKLAFDLSTGKPIESGIGCIRWIDNNQIIVYSTNYQGGTPVGLVNYYLVNLLSGSKIFLHSSYSGR